MRRFCLGTPKTLSSCITRPSVSMKEITIPATTTLEMKYGM